MSEAGDLEVSSHQEPLAKTAEAVKTQEAERPPLDALLVFGQGPVIDSESRVSAGGEVGHPVKEDVNFWSDTIATAAWELYKRKQTREIVVMGGKTGGEEYASEAQLIAGKMEKLGIPTSAIKLEQTSTNTLENIVNMLNQYPELAENGRSIGILGSNYHIGRLRVLMEMFDVPIAKNVFSSEEVFRFAARDQEEWDHGALLDIENRLNLNEAQVPLSQRDAKLSPGYYGLQKGEERTTIDTRLKQDDVWRRVLDEIPEYWIGYLGRLNDPERARVILQKRGDVFLEQIKSRFQIDPSVASDQESIQKLRAVERAESEGEK